VGADTSGRHSHGGALPRDCRVVDVRHYGSFVAVELAAPDIAGRAQPGQFVMVAVPAPGFHLRRPLSLFRAGGDRLALLIEVRGKGTAALAAVAVGDTVSVSGPLGSGFPLDGVTEALLVGGGIGAAPLQLLAERLTGGGATVSAAFGFRDARQARLVSAFDIERLWVSTEDGSMGSRGTVVDLLDGVPRGPFTTLYACGPLPMLAALQRWAAAHGIGGFASLEAHMACGSGSCHGCVLPTARGYARVCAEGPVLPLAELVFP